MHNASLHSTPLAGPTKVAAGQRTAPPRPVNHPTGAPHTAQGTATPAPATSFTLPIVTHPLSASLMAVLIALLSGISDAAALVATLAP